MARKLKKNLKDVTPQWLYILRRGCGLPIHIPLCPQREINAILHDRGFDKYKRRCAKFRSRSSVLQREPFVQTKTENQPRYRISVFRATDEISRL